MIGLLTKDRDDIDNHRIGRSVGEPSATRRFARNPVLGGGRALSEVTFSLELPPLLGECFGLTANVCPLDREIKYRTRLLAGL
jgi:hypothetical protein